MIRYPLQQASGSHTLFHLINRLLVLTDVALLLWFVMFVPVNSGITIILTSIHLVLLTPSLMYHLMPFVRGKIMFKLFAHLISFIVLGAFFFSVVVLIDQNKRLERWAMIIIILLITLPGSLVSFSLLLLLNSGQKKPQISYLLTQDGKLYQEFMAI
ncbi:unnamed protein product [Moneuplotes crassus]|uniref:Uncharacterized protein n=1 Tax=Euplotes crassus TaxID=5936 RepID=A0AAD2D7X3_EUPCR|nr:unnamed protein product [Moneuplotes crassus]